VRLGAATESADATTDPTDGTGEFGADGGHQSGESQFDGFDAGATQEGARAGVRAECRDGAMPDAELDGEVGASQGRVYRAEVDGGRPPERADERGDGPELEEHPVLAGRDPNRMAVHLDVEVGVDGQWDGRAVVTHVRAW